MERQQPLGPQDLVQQHIDHAAVAEHRDGLVVVGAVHQGADALADARQERGFVDAAGQLPVEQPLELGRVLGRDLLDRDVVRQVPVVFGEALVDLDTQAQCVGDGLSGLDGAHLRAAHHPGDREAGQRVGQSLRLFDAFGR